MRIIIILSYDFIRTFSLHALKVGNRGKGCAYICGPPYMVGCFPRFPFLATFIGPCPAPTGPAAPVPPTLR